MDIDGIERPALLPVVPASSPARCSSRRDDKELALAVRAGVERLHARRVVRRRARPVSSRSSSCRCGTSTRAWPRWSGASRKGAKAISFPENPAPLGLPSFHTDHWDPVFAAGAGGRPPAVHALRVVGPRAGDRERRTERRVDRAVRLQLDVDDRRPALLAGVPHVRPAQGRAVRGRHRMGAVHARAPRLHVGPPPLLLRDRPGRPSVRALRPPLLRLLHRRRVRPREPPRRSASTTSPGSATTRTPTRSGRTAASTRPRCCWTSPTTRSTRSSSSTRGRC